MYLKALMQEIKRERMEKVVIDKDLMRNSIQMFVEMGQKAELVSN